MYLHLKHVFITFMYIQGDLRGKVNIFSVENIGRCEKNSPHEHVSKSEWLASYSCLNVQI
jgi:hypothetical protein